MGLGPLSSLLDPRPRSIAQAAPFEDAVNIPLDELQGRTFELPDRSRVIPVTAGEPWGSAAVRLLRALRREAELEEATLAAELAPTPGRLWRPNEWLERITRDLTPRRALDLACGVGREAVFLAASGWEVTAVDVLPDALERGADLERRYAGEAPAIRWVQADLERDWKPERSFELITCFRFLNRSLLRRVSGWLAPGGRLAVETFTTRHRERNPRPRRAEFLLGADELRNVLSNLELCEYDEGWRRGAHTARALALRRGELSA